MMTTKTITQAGQKITARYHRWENGALTIESLTVGRSTLRRVEAIYDALWALGLQENLTPTPEA